MKLNDKVYDALKWITLVGLPAIAVLYTGISKIWSLPFGSEVVETLSIVEVFIGSLIGISTASYNSEKNK